MIATKFEPHDNWLPPGYYVPKHFEQALINSGVPETHWNMADMPDLSQLNTEEISAMIKEKNRYVCQIVNVLPQIKQLRHSGIF